MTHEKFLEVEQKVKDILEDCQDVDYGFDGEKYCQTALFMLGCQRLTDQPINSEN